MTTWVRPSTAAAVIMTVVAAASAAPAKRSAAGKTSTAYLVKDIDGTVDVTAGSAPGPFLEANGAVWFAAQGGLWRTDGTPAGTVAVRAAGVSGLTRMDGTLFFA
jgi:hypothetical protein